MFQNVSINTELLFRFLVKLLPRKLMGISLALMPLKNHCISLWEGFLLITCASRYQEPACNSQFLGVPADFVSPCFHSELDIVCFCGYIFNFFRLASARFFGLLLILSSGLFQTVFCFLRFFNFVFKRSH